MLIHSSINGHLHCCHLLAIVNNAAMDMGIQISAQDSAFNSFAYTCRSDSEAPYSNSIFNSFRNHHTVFRSGYTISHSYQQCASVPISSHPYQHLLFSVIGVKWYLIIVFICLSLVIRDVQLCFLAICILSLKKCLFKFFSYNVLFFCFFGFFWSHDS